MDWSKLSSGKFLLTLICGFVFAYVSIRKIIPPDAVVPILAMVFISYFQKNPEPNSGETTTQTTEVKTNEEKKS